jgi:hypothetical protein
LQENYFMGNQKDKALGQTVRERDIKRIDDLCFILKNGTPAEAQKAQAEILLFFDAYLNKYVSLFTMGPSDFRRHDTYDTRAFFAMFLTHREKTAKAFAEQARYINHVLSRFSREELKSELTLLFLTVLSKYRIVEGVNALNPLTKIFRWRVKDWFNRLARDPMLRTIQFDTDADLDFFLEVNASEPLTDSEMSFDFAWLVCPPHNYEILTPYERYLCFLVFYQGYPLIEIARKLDRDKDTIRRHWKLVLDKFREIV